MRGVVDTLVVGAGLSGLAYAHARGPGADLLVLEATERPGGLVRTTRAPLASFAASVARTRRWRASWHSPSAIITFNPYVLLCIASFSDFTMVATL